MEIFKDIPEYEGFYRVSNIGRVMSIRFNEKLLKPRLTDDGYLKVTLCKIGVNKTIQIHRLVCMAFIQSEIKLPLSVNHINAIKTDNRLENLEIIPLSDNYKHAKNLGLLKNFHGKQKLSDDDVREIRKSNKSASEFSKIFNIHNCHVYDIKKGIKRGNVK